MSSGYWVGMIQPGTRVHNAAGGAVLRTAKQNEDISWTTEFDGWAHVSSSFGSGWVRSGDIYDRQWVSTAPSYSKAGRPTSLSVPGMAEGMAILTFSGATNGTNNGIRGYIIQSSDSNDGTTWGTWENFLEFDSTSGSGTFNVTVNPARGAYRKFRMRTKGAAGTSWYSDWSTETSAVRTNRAPLAPTVKVERITYSLKPTIVVELGAEPDGQAQSVYCDDELMDISGNKARLELSLGFGIHNLEIKVIDAMEAETIKSHTVEVKAANYARNINAGDFISSGAYKHTDEVRQLYTLVNAQRAFYQLDALAVPNTIGLYAQWKAQMETLMSGLDECMLVVGKAPKSRPSLVRSYPKAEIINFIRLYIAEV